MSTSILAAPVTPSRYAAIHYDESTEGSFWFIIKGVILTLLTVGIYRFWFTTALRKNLWARAFIDGSPVEYVGKAHELLLGFLVAIAVLLPVYIGAFIATMYLPDPILGYLTVYILLFLLVQFARYRARRYIASRTLWRGIRFQQDGSALAYTALATGWTLITLVTLGVAYPFMRASLERYRMGHTLLGEARFASDARGQSLIGNWFIVYALGVLPLLGCAVALLAFNNFKIPMAALQGQSISENATMLYLYYIQTLPKSTIRAIVFTAAGSFALWMVLTPYYRARETRSFCSAVKVGGTQLNSKLSATEIYINSFFFYFSIAMTFSLMIVLGFVAGIILSKIELEIDIAQYVYGYVAFCYAVFILLVSWFYFRFLQVGRLASVVGSLSISGAEALADVTVSTRKVGGRFAEGVADAVDPGGIEIGF